MFPVIHIFGINIYPYGMMIGIGLVTAVLLFIKRCKNRGYDEDSAFNIAVLCCISGIIGAKVLFLIIELPQVLRDPMAVLKDFGNGFVIYGGIIFGILAAYIFARFKKWSFLNIFDTAVPLISLAQGFGRIGCFFAGCCYGRETDSFIGMEFNNSPFAPHNVHIIPTQLISSIGNFIIFGILLWFDNKKKTRNGQTGALYLVLYSIGRFIIEIFRDDPRGTVFNVLSSSQFICIFMFLAGVAMLYLISRKAKNEDIEVTKCSDEKASEDLIETVENEQAKAIDELDDNTNLDDKV